MQEVPLSSTASVSDTRTTGAGSPEIVIYTTAICPYCVAAKNFLKSKGQSWTEIRIGPTARAVNINRS